MEETGFMRSHKRSIPPQRSGESGVALILVLLIALMLSIVSVGIVFTIQTDALVASNYKYGNEAFHVAEAGIQRTVNWFNNGYAPHLPVSDFTRTASPVQFGGQNATLAGQSGYASNYPDSSITSSFSTSLSNQTLTADSRNQGEYAVNATLLRTQPVNLLFGGVGAVERWRVDAQGIWGSSANILAKNQTSAIIENPGFNVFD